MPLQTSMVIFDANMILRYLLNDNERMADQAERYLNAGSVSVTIEVMAEVVYVLKGVYAMKRGKIAETLLDFLTCVNCPEMEVLKTALSAFAVHNLDFVDCVLLAYHNVKGAEIATFDRKLRRLL